MTEEFGPWVPLAIDDVAQLLDPLGLLWWVAGGHALDLHVGSSWRTHDDLDVGVRRSDAPLLAPLLDDWRVEVAADGRLTPWFGQPLDAAANQNNLWIGHRDGAWALDVLIGEGDDERWIYRRDPNLSLPWKEVLAQAPTGERYLAAWLQLLFKSRGNRAKDRDDAAVVIPTLRDDDRTRLAHWLPDEHPWQSIVAAMVDERRSIKRPSPE
jgi:hypothetical protein